MLLLHILMLLSDLVAHFSLCYILKGKHHKVFRLKGDLMFSFVGQSFVRWILATTLCFSAYALQAAESTHRLLPFKQWSQNGVPVYAISAPELPMLDIMISFHAGSAYDPVGAKGLASLTTHLLEEGAGPYSAHALVETMEQHGANISFQVDRDKSVIHLRTLNGAKHLKAVIPVLLAVLQEPHFSPESFAMVKDQTLTILKMHEQKPAKQAADLFYATLYANHPYASPVDGLTHDVKSMTRSNVVTFHKQHYTQQSAIITMVGQMSEESFRNLAGKIVSSLPSGTNIKPLPPMKKQREAQHFVTFPSTQTTMVLGQIGVDLKNPDRLALVLANKILGGGSFESLLYKRVRQDQGLAYSAYSYFNALAEPGPFVVGLQTRDEKAPQALSITRKTVAEFYQGQFSKASFKLAKDGMKASFPLKITNNQDMIGALTAVAFYQLPSDYFDTYLARLSTLNYEEVISTWRKHIQKHMPVQVAVGQHDPFFKPS